jgi:hypothetical protein
MTINKLFIAAVLIAATAALATAQRGGKAEPKRIEFVPRRSSVTLTGTLANGREREYVFASRKGQIAKIKMNTRLFDYRIFLPDADFDTEFDSSPTSAVELPETGDYLLFIRKKMTSTNRSAKFNILVSVQ